MADLYYREKPREAMSHEGYIMVTITDPDPMRLYKNLRSGWHDFKHWLGTTNYEPFSIRMNSDGEFDGMKIMIDQDRMLLMVDTESHTVPVVETRHSLFSSWKEETYRSYDNVDKKLEELKLIAHLMKADQDCIEVKHG